MRKLLLLLLTACAYAQNPNPQTNWSSQMSLAGPTNWLTFNQLTTPYLDSVTGTNWSAQPYFYTLGAGSNPATLSSAFASGYVILAGSAASSSCTIGEVQIQFYAAPGATGTLPVLTTTGTAPNFTVTQVATISYANTTALQTFVVGSGLSTSFPISSGSWVGTWGNSSQVLPGRGSSSTGYSYPAASSLPSGSNAYTSTSVGPSISASCETATGTILSGQAGFDATNPQQYSVSVPYNAPIIAPNDATGDFEYTQPWTLVKQIDNLQYAGSGVKYLVTKGNLGSNARPWWELYLTTYSGAPQLCFQINAATALYSAYNGVCSSTQGTQNLLPNGYNYTIVVTNAGGAGGGGAFQMFINGQPQTGALTISHYPGYLVSIAGSGGTGYSTTVPAIATSGTGGGGFLLATVTTSGGAFSSINIPIGYNYGFTSTPTVQIAPYVVAVTTAGSGYTGTATFTSTGGGCPSGSIAGTITTSGGGLSTISYTNESSLCTSAPTINITGTGTGGVVTASATPGSGMTLTPTASLGTLSTATTYPIINDGANVNGVLQGFSTVSTDSPLYDDEVAFFNTNLNETQGQALFYNTKFYQLGLYPSLPRVKLIWDNDCADPDNPYSLAFTIALHHAGILDLQAVIVEANDPYCFATYRQMLDQAGMNNVPVARPSSFVAGSSGSYTSANVTTFNASTDTTIADYPLAATVYCAILAANPTTPIYVQLTGGMRGYVDFQQSASGTCTATQSGAQLQAQNATNGGEIFLQGLLVPGSTSLGFCGASCTTSSDNLLIDYLAGQYLVTHNCAVSPCIPMIWTGSTPQQSGPGPLYTLTSKSPLYLFAVTQGLDTRQAYDSLALAQFISPQFTGGVGITIGGSGTGYATNTTYNLSGCTYGVGSFVMVSSGGVPASITYPTTYASTGIGYGFNGCTPTVTQVGSTGSGATLTPYSTQQCGTVTVNSSVLVTVATASCATAQQYFQYAGNYSLNGYPPILTWFLSSLIDRPPQGQVRPQ